MRALSVLVLPVIVWTGPARTMPLTVNVLRKTALLILLQHVQVLSLAKQPVAETVNNVAPIPVPAVQNPIPVPMPRQLNAEPSVIIAIPAVLQEAHLIPVRWLDITNAAQPADPVPIPVPAVQNLLPVIPVTQRQQSLLRNAEALVIPVRPMPAADTALPAARVTVPAVPACPAQQQSTSLTLVTPVTQCRVPVASRMILVIIILQKHAPTDVRHTIPTVRQSARPVTPITATTEPRSSLPVRQMRPAPTSPTAPPKSKVGPATPDIRSREVPV